MHRPIIFTLFYLGGGGTLPHCTAWAVNSSAPPPFVHQTPADTSTPHTPVRLAPPPQLHPHPSPHTSS